MKILIQKQKHSCVVNFVNQETENWTEGDAMITDENNLALIAYGADCAILAFWQNDQIGICHAGWRGFASGLIKQMAKLFSGGNCFVGPFFHEFEIQKDECFEKIKNYCGEQYFSQRDSKVFFDFKTAVLDELSELDIELDPRNTFLTPELASWRRDKKRGDGTQNRLVVWRDGQLVKKRVFLPNEIIKDYFKFRVEAE